MFLPKIKMFKDTSTKDKDTKDAGFKDKDAKDQLAVFLMWPR